MLYPEIIREAIAAIRRQTNVPIYLYTAMPEQLDALMPLLDGVTAVSYTHLPYRMATTIMHYPCPVIFFCAILSPCRSLLSAMICSHVYPSASSVSSTASV